MVYLVLCGFLLGYLKKIRINPQYSPTYESDLKRREELLGQMQDIPQNQHRVYAVFFAIQGALLVAIACVREISGFAIPILAASFLVSGLIAEQLACKDFRRVVECFLQGGAAMLPAVAMIALASSVKLVMVESNIIDTVMYAVLQLLEGRGKFVTILFIYGLILFLQLFIGLSMANVSYWKWIKWTWKLQALLFAISVAVLFFGVLVGY